MASSEPTPTQIDDRRRDIDRWLGNYSEDHRNPINIKLHHLCVPLIVWSVVAALWILPVPGLIGRPGLWAALAIVAATGFYLRLSRPLALVMLLLFAALSALTDVLHRTIGTDMLLLTAIAVFVLAWVGQFVGHQIEGKRPSFLTDLVYLLIGPVWIAAKLMRRMHIAY